VANNNYPQITSVTSEALQSQIRALLPSQEGFGTDLMAQNVIVPIIDLTSAAEGSNVPENLQTALAFGSQTAFSFSNSSGVITNDPGFWRIYAASTIEAASSTTISNRLTLSDGLSTKTIWEHFASNAGDALTALNIDITVFLAAGESVNGVSTSGLSGLIGSVRQIADVNGTLVNPSGFSPQ
jgi:hypothetical protein